MFHFNIKTMTSISEITHLAGSLKKEETMKISEESISYTIELLDLQLRKHTLEEALKGLLISCMRLMKIKTLLVKEKLLKLQYMR